MSMFPRLNAIIDKLAGLVHDKHEDVIEKVKEVRERIHEDRARRYDIPADFLKQRLAELAAPRKLNPETSIVDFLKVLDMPSTKEARAELADEFGYDKGEFIGTPEQNKWLHRQVMEALKVREIALPYR